MSCIRDYAGGFSHNESVKQTYFDKKKYFLESYLKLRREMKEWYPKSENHPIPQGTNIYIYIFSNIKKGWFSVVKKCV